ncbi:MAG: 16S rRNA (guanine(966)-N(2))-methyltransferase RsmD [Campylobacter sp.]|nr:16S rRNA (guanine(966)-N(2))-methyltransferase RsmD [Campylobacter sp.]
MKAVITSGIFKGKKLILPSLETTRSTKAIVKESFLDSYRDEIRGRVFIEGFGGSGLMAASALSNGAKLAYAIEKDRDAYEILKQNFTTLSPKLRAINADFFKVIDEILVENLGVILYIDPPFDIRVGFDEIYNKVCEFIKHLNKKRAFLVAIEHHSKIELPQNLGEFNIRKTKKFGRTALSYYE